MKRLGERHWWELAGKRKSSAEEGAKRPHGKHGVLCLGLNGFEEPGVWLGA